MRICRLVAGDSAIAVAAIQQIKSAQTTTEHVTRFLKRSDYYFVAAIEGDQPLGFALAYELQRIDRADPMLFLYEIGVAEAYQRQGVASAIIDFLKRICYEKGMFKMFVIASASNAAALRLYDSTFGDTRRTEESVVFAIPTNS